MTVSSSDEVRVEQDEHHEKTSHQEPYRELVVEEDERECGPVPPGKIRCSACKKDLPANKANFIPRRENRSGFCGTCRLCMSEQRREAHKRRARNASLEKEGKKECIRCGQAQWITQFRTGPHGKPQNVCKSCAYDRAQSRSSRRPELDALKIELGLDLRAGNRQIAAALADREESKEENAKARDAEAQAVYAEDMAILQSGWMTTSKLFFSTPLYRTEDGERSIPIESDHPWDQKDKLRMIQRDSVTLKDLVQFYKSAWRYITSHPLSESAQPLIEVEVDPNIQSSPHNHEEQGLSRRQSVAC